VDDNIRTGYLRLALDTTQEDGWVKQVEVLEEPSSYPEHKACAFKVLFQGDATFGAAASKSLALFPAPRIPDLHDLGFRASMGLSQLGTGVRNENLHHQFRERD
jgi:hypothetical protein